MRKGSVIGAEALIRWLHPEEGLLLPGRFLPSIADSELEIEVGDWVIRAVGVGPAAEGAGGER